MAVFNNILAGASGATGAAAGYEITRSLRFNSNDSANLSKTFASAGNRRTFTLSFWAKLAYFADTDPTIFGTYTDSNNRSNLILDTSEGFQLGFYSRIGGTTQLDLKTNALLRDNSAW